MPIVLVMDDEPQYLQWLFEYLAAKGFQLEITSSLAEAANAVKSRKYRAIIADLSVPVPPDMEGELKRSGNTYLEYPGLYVAHQARNRGYRSRQVIVYSVHDSASVKEIATRIGVCYITKGRPRMLKEELDSIFSYDPTKDK